MTRALPEWIGKSDDEPVPDRVRTRVFLAHDGICGECGTRISKCWVCDHRIAIINGGENRESNLQPIHQRCDRKVKTPRDVKQKSKDYRVRMRHIGLQQQGKRKLPGGRDSPIKMKIGGGWEYRK